MDERPNTANVSAERSMQALYAYLPQIMEAYNAQAVPTEVAKLQAAQATSPAYNELLYNIYKNYAPKMAEAGSSIDRQNRIAQAKTDEDILNTSGRNLAKIYKDIDKETNPEYYKVRENTSNKLIDLLGSVNINDATPEAERLVNQESVRSGNIATPSATSTVSNALQFGNERMKRVNALSEAIGRATDFIQPSQNTQFNAATTALNKPTSNTGLSEFGGVNKAGGENYASGNNYLNAISGFQNNAMQINANRRDVIDRINEGFSTA
jgi:hypothetical protein